MSPFGAYVAALIAKRGLTQTSFAKRVGMTQPHVAQLLGGRWPMKVQRIDAWADALNLAGAERRRFRIEALLTRCPEEIRNYVRALRARPARSAVLAAVHQHHRPTTATNR